MIAHEEYRHYGMLGRAVVRTLVCGLGVAAMFGVGWGVISDDPERLGGVLALVGGVIGVALGVAWPLPGLCLRAEIDDEEIRLHYRWDGIVSIRLRDVTAAAGVLGFSYREQGDMIACTRVVLTTTSEGHFLRFDHGGQRAVRASADEELSRGCRDDASRRPSVCRLARRGR